MSSVLHKYGHVAQVPGFTDCVLSVHLSFVRKHAKKNDQDGFWSVILLTFSVRKSCFGFHLISLKPGHVLSFSGHFVAPVHGDLSTILKLENFSMKWNLFSALMIKELYDQHSHHLYQRECACNANFKVKLGLFDFSTRLFIILESCL